MAQTEEKLVCICYTGGYCQTRSGISVLLCWEITSSASLTCLWAPLTTMPEFAKLKEKKRSLFIRVWPLVFLLCLPHFVSFSSYWCFQSCFRFLLGETVYDESHYSNRHTTSLVWSCHVMQTLNLLLIYFCLNLAGQNYHCEVHSAAEPTGNLLWCCPLWLLGTLRYNQLLIPGQQPPAFFRRNKCSLVVPSL